jgi:DNA-binding transcriptional regulator PaaX
MWYFINIEFTDDNKERKAEFFDKLQQQGFALLNTNTWVTPYHQSDDLWGLIEKYDLINGVTEIYGEMRIHKDMGIFLDDTFAIKKLQVSYQKFIDDFGSKLNEIKLQSNSGDFVEKGLALPILHELGWNFFGIASEDAVLPKQILPDWDGDKAALIMKEMREILSDASNKYLEKFNY